MNQSFRKATLEDADSIWKILQQAIERRKADGSTQWQDGYPNPEVIQADIARSAGYVLVAGGEIAGYCAVFENDEPAYNAIRGAWLSTGNFLVVHRVAVGAAFAGRGLAQQILVQLEDLARAHKICSIKADTNFDNPAMMRTFEKLGYVYCGEVELRGNPRRAYEKLLTL